MNKAQYEKIALAVDNEGFDYCFTDYSDWQHITDPEFQKLRSGFCEARDKLDRYLQGLADKYDR